MEEVKKPSQEISDTSVTSDNLYLHKLQFNPELRKTWLNFFVTNFRVVILLIILMTAWGFYSYFKLPREANPEVKIPMAFVMTIYPGASPGDVEELVTKKIETGISGLSGVKKITSSSMNSSSSITVEFEANENLDDAIRKLRDKVNTLKGDLPDTVNEPIVKEISFDDRPIWTIGITGPFDGFTLRRYADTIKDELEKIPGVREIQIAGGDEEEFEIAYDPGKLLFYGISADQANQVVKATNLAYPSGDFDGSNFRYSIRTDSRFFDADRLAGIPISHTQDNAIIYLKDLAKVKSAAIKKTLYSRLSIIGSNPENAVTLNLVKKLGSSILDTTDEARATVDRLMATFPKGMTYDVNTDFSKEIRTQFEQLTHDFLLTLFLVIGILFIIVGLKEALVAGLAIPLVFFVSFGVMLVTGISLNFLSIFSLLLALGLLVDDAIVVVSATKQYLRTGKFTPEEAVLLVLNDFKVVLTTTTLTTVWAFLPLLLSTGIIGSFIRSIPITVSVTLVSSLLIALMINHPLAAVMERIRLTKNWFFFYSALIFIMAALFFSQKTFIFALAGFIMIFIFAKMARWYMRGGKEKLLANAKMVDREWNDDELIKKKLYEAGHHKDTKLSDRLTHGIIPFHKILPYYEKYLRAVLTTKRARIITLAATFLIFIGAVALPATGIVKSEFFPASDENIIYLSIEAPVGLKLDETDKITQKVEERLLKYPDILNFSTVVGRQGTSSHVIGATSSSANLASIVMTLKDTKDRNITSYDLAKKIRKDVADIKGAKITIESASGGPPSGSAFEAQISGDDLQAISKIAHDLEPVLNTIPGVVDSDISLKSAPMQYTFALDPVKMEQNYLNAAYVGSVLRMAISGTEITTVIKGNKEISVMASFDENKIPDLESIQNLQILNLAKQPVYLKDVAKIELQPSVDSITRIDQKRVISLSAGVEGKTNANTVLAEFKKKISDYELPQGYNITYGGQNEQNTESVFSILRAMIIAALLIVSTLVIQFNSFKKAVIVLVTFPLALIGVFVGLAIFRVTLSFPGLIGVLALFGIVVKNAIILIDKINLNIRHKIPFFEAVVDAGKARLEAIFITSICTIFGIIPVTLSNETWMSLGTAIIFGLSLSSFLTLFIIPVLYVALIRPKERF
jgi:multidrug efflux pump subunit AcrB